MTEEKKRPACPECGDEEHVYALGNDVRWNADRQKWEILCLGDEGLECTSCDHGSTHDSHGEFQPDDGGFPDPDSALPDGSLSGALSVEVSPVRFEADGSVSLMSEEPTYEGGFGVYIRNPLAFHVQDFGPESVDPDRRVTLEEAKAAAFKYADALADHLGCSVETHVARPAADDETTRFTVDGHEFDNEESNLAGDGEFPPFRVFDVPAQDYRPGVYATREEAQAVADALTSAEG